MSELAEYTICELMGLMGLKYEEQKECADQLEKTVSDVFLSDALTPSLPQEEMDILIETLKRDEVNDTWSGSIPMNRLPTLRGSITRRLEWLVSHMIREEIKYLIDLCAEDVFAQKLLWRIRAHISSENWHDVVLAMGFLEAKHRIPQKISIFELCYENALERYHAKYKEPEPPDLP